MRKSQAKNSNLTEQLRDTLLSEVPCGLCVARQDERLTLVFANESFCSMFGYDSFDQAVESGFTGVLDRAEEADRETAMRALKTFAAGEDATLEVETRQRKRDGTPVWTMIRLRRAALNGGVFICAVIDITAQKKGEEQLRIREEEYRVAIRQSDKLVFRYEIKNHAAHFTPELAELFGQEHVLGLPVCMVAAGMVHPDSLEAFNSLFEEIDSGRQTSGSVVLQLRLGQDSADGAWYRADYSIVCGSEGKPAQAVISLQNVSGQHERELAYKKWEQTYTALPQESFAYLEFDLTRDRFRNRRGGLIGPLPESLVPTMENVMRYFIGQWVHEKERAGLKAYTARERLLRIYCREEKTGSFDYRHRHADGVYRWVRVSAQMLPDPYSSSIQVFLLFRDIDSEKREEMSIQDRLCTDSLTGVLNRKAFTERAELLLSDSELDGMHAFVMVDADRFKQVNDRFGHGYGDRVLVKIAETLQSAVRAGDLVARMGGDEFALLLKNVISKEALMAKLAYLNEQIYQRINSDMVVSCSFGAACFPSDGETFDDLYFKADVALYAAKEQGRNCAHIYENGTGRPVTLFESKECSRS